MGSRVVLLPLSIGAPAGSLWVMAPAAVAGVEMHLLYISHFGGKTGQIWGMSLEGWGNWFGVGTAGRALPPLHHAYLLRGQPVEVVYQAVYRRAASLESGERASWTLE